MKIADKGPDGSITKKSRRSRGKVIALIFNTMKAIVAVAALALAGSTVLAQDSKKADSAQVLEEVMVRAYETNRRLIEVPAAISVVSNAQLRRFSNTSLLPAVNTSPGVRMEERSPGSYRLNIRGSSLRSPFGVRNVKIYYNDIPYTDPGGNTYLNQLGFYNVGSIEIIKGPGSSLYGAGTGGVMLLKSETDKITRGLSLDYTGGSYGSNTVHLGLRSGNDVVSSTTNYLYQTADGYRNHTRLERKMYSWDGVAKVGKKGVLKAHFLTGDLFYETPGALTLSEYQANPRAARPRSGQTPGSEEAQASISQRMFLAGLSYTTVWNDHFRSVSSLYGAYSRLENPTVRNFERRTEPHFGSRNMLEYNGKINRSKVQVQAGLEAQQQYTTSRVYQNKGGISDTLQTDDEITNTQEFGFLQGTVETANGWFLTAGGSLNLLDVELTRLSLPSSDQKKRYNNQVAPRVAVLKKITPLISAYGSVAKGFSPPTSAEILPSTGVISTSLQAEEGWNTEGGARGNVFHGRLYFDVNLFYFRLRNTISQRRDSTGGDYFVNAGSTQQKGTETYLSYRVTEKSNPLFDNCKIWISHTWSDFHYKSFQKIASDTANYSGKRLPSVPKNFVSAGLDVILKMGAYANVTYYYSDPVPLNDANTAIASSYQLLGARAGYRKVLGKYVSADLYITADNIFNEKYSLGNDINAAGGRYYNAAPGANYSAGVSFNFRW